MTEPRWLDESEARAWRGYQRMRQLLAAQLARDLSRETGLSEADYTVLVVLSEAPECRARLIELTHRTLWSKSRLSHQLDRMERRGLVRREEHADNTRATDAVLTAEGLRIIEQAAPAHVAAVRRHFIDLLTDQQIDVLAEATEHVVAHLLAAGEFQAIPNGHREGITDGDAGNV